MSGGSLLTQGLEPLGSKSKPSAAHQQAKRDDDFGEEVVPTGEAEDQVPWQLRMTIDDLELTNVADQYAMIATVEATSWQRQLRYEEGERRKPPKQNQVPAETAPTVQSGRVTVLGCWCRDGNFSYSRAFLRANSARIAASEINVTVTSLDTESQLVEMYPKSRDILDELRSGGVHVRHGVNATKLETYSFKDKGDATNPLADGGVGNKNKRNKIHRHRQLLVDFFASASQVLASDGQIWEDEAGEEDTSSGRYVADRSLRCCCRVGAQDAHFCPVDALAELGYYSVGYQSREKAFWTEDGISHVFCLEAPGRKSFFPVEWTRDISFWVTDEEMFTEELLHDVVREHFPPETMNVSISLLDEYRCEKSGRKSVTYRLDISSSSLALSRDRCTLGYRKLILRRFSRNM
ncbi:protein of unknown function DUF2431 [Phytophthora cactorum]|nr:protein of unknown function DUF2431 [Phytophthora cactorum]